MLDYLGTWNQSNAGAAAAGPDIKDDKSRQPGKYGSMTGLGASINLENMKDR